MKKYIIYIAKMYFFSYIFYLKVKDMHTFLTSYVNRRKRQKCLILDVLRSTMIRF